jgi:citrate lyase beta subunit
MKKNVRRSVLFVPALRVDRFEKATSSIADAITIDMEDAVSPDFKDEGRLKCIEALETVDFKDKEIIVRINTINSLTGMKDLVALNGSKVKPDHIMLPKTETAEEVRQLDKILNEIDPTIGIIPIIESAAGINKAFEIAYASTKNIALCFGGGDLSGELGCPLEWDSMLYTRNAVKVAAAAAQIDCLDVPYLKIKDDVGLTEESVKVKALGYNTKVAIHPAQLASINKVFTPSEAEVKWAREIDEAVQAKGSGVIVVNGKMVDTAIVKLSKRILNMVKELK